MSKLFGLLSILSLVFTPYIGLAQDGPALLLYQKNGAEAGDFLGASVAPAEDVNGDGSTDFIIGAPNADPRGLLSAGSVYVYSGATGALLYQKDGAVAGERLGMPVASTGDLNGDGKADFIIGAYFASPGGLNGAGSAYVYSGADGSLLFQKDGIAAGDRLGRSVASAGDVNGDGMRDFIIGAEFADPNGLNDAGSAFVYSGADGSMLYQKDGAGASYFLGISVASASDIDGDAKSDFVIGAYAASPGGLNGAGSAYVYSGATGALLYQKNGIAAADHLGWSVASAGDVNGDGKSDLIIGALGTDVGGQEDAGSAYVYSGTDGSLLYQKHGSARYTYLGNSVASTGDANGDGKSDFIIGAPGLSSGSVGAAYVYSGANGDLLYQKKSTTIGDQLGYSVASAGDVNKDGQAEFIIGAPSADHGELALAGSALVYTLCSNFPGDLDGDNSLSSVDVVLELNCVFLASGNCGLCLADRNCDGRLSPADVVIELNLVFLSISATCTP